MNTFKALLQREYWEHRGAFLKTPLIMGSLMSIFLILFYLTVEQFDLRVGGGQYIELGSATMDELDTSGIQSAIDIFMLFTGSIFHFVLFIILFFFLLGSLYDDRKDGSILFWKSLPVSDTQTVLSKFTTAIVVVPIIFTLGLMVSHLFFFIIGSLIFLLNGINPFTILWSNINFINNWGAFLVGCLAQAAWALPIYGWLLFSSAYSKRRPFLMAVFLPLIVGFGWYFYNAIVNLEVLKVGVFKTIGIVMAKATTPFTSGMGFDLESVDFDPTQQTSGELIRSMLNGLTNPSIYYGMIFAAIAIAMAIYVRRFRNTT